MIERQKAVTPSPNASETEHPIEPGKRFENSNPIETTANAD
jgi:hypothetical protein